MTKCPIMFRMGTGWNVTPLVRGGSQQSLYFTWAVYYRFQLKIVTRPVVWEA